MDRPETNAPDVKVVSGSNATPLVLRYSCRATLCRIFRLTFSQCRTRIALRPLKCLKKRPCRTLWGECDTSTLHCIDHKNFKLSRGTRGCRSYSAASRATLRHQAQPGGGATKKELEPNRTRSGPPEMTTGKVTHVAL